jgi:glutamyl-tRNA synthetase
MSWAIDDHLLGITHVLRGKDLMMESEMEKYIWGILGWKSPVLIHTGLVNIAGVKLSTSKSQKEVSSKKYIGWNDPRTWSLQSLKSRGINADAIRAFCLSLGMTQTEVTVPIENLYKENKKLVENSNRYFFIQDPVKIKIKGAPRTIAKVPLHPDHAERGYRIIRTEQEFYVSKQDYEEIKKTKQDIFRLMNLFNCKKTKKGFEFHSQELQPLLKAKLIHWLPIQGGVKTKVLMPNGVFVRGLAEDNIKNIRTDEIIQFERFGFCRFEKKKKDFIFWFAHK